MIGLNERRCVSSKPQFDKKYLADGREVMVLARIGKRHKPERYEKKVEQALDQLYKTKKHNAPQFGVSLSVWPQLDVPTYIVTTEPDPVRWTVKILRKTQEELLDEEPT